MVTSTFLLGQEFTGELIQLGNELLSLVEIEEAKLLNWGFVQGTLDLQSEAPALFARLPESTRALWQQVQQQGYSQEEILQSLSKRQLLFRLEDGSYRTRFAETVRLLYLLRQRFSFVDWATAPKLVSDLKLQLQRRSYPARTLTVADIEERLQAPSALQQAVIRRLLGADDAPLLLAHFQGEAIERQLDNLRQGRDKGVIIGAGTGAGKTKAFYIPAFAQIAQAIDPAYPHLQALAIYPRNELLKDQLAEAFAEARKLDDILSKPGKRPITIGAYFGETPESAEWLEKYPSWSRKEKRGYICPYLNCPKGHPLLWEQKDVAAEKAANQRGHYGRHTRLRCTVCQYETVPGQLALTRKEMRQAPPDILFTSTEMLNRRLSSTEDFALLGIRQSRLPRLMLLDEIHTYEGITGAQTAYLLRRWRHARGHRPNQNLCISGLSATLTAAPQFLARLTGIAEHDIDYIAPKAEEMVEEGMEYNLVLKGDPVSATSLLSTSIQSAMLLGRVLDPGDDAPSQGAYGQRIFAFTDKLDVINRWYQAMFDAEFKKKLSQYRQALIKDQPPLALRKAQGQVWDMSQMLGYDLTQPLPISRTTSQDRGVNDKSKMVIATSTLEVGFNDKRVGAVLQHKAPRSLASFLQRKGRAGRRREMRPWTVVVTSAYGRDRWAFQHAEDLFNPMLPPIELPLENYYVRKVQAAYIVMDWAAMKFYQANKTVSLWQLLRAGSQNARSDYHQSNRSYLLNLLAGILSGKERASFESYLQQTMGIEADDPILHNVLWGEPRSLYYEVIPTLLRQLKTKWRRITAMGEEEWGDFSANYPMPEFVPPTLFGDLNLPEVQVRLPSAENNGDGTADDQIQAMPIGQVIAEFAPGRANKRFVTQYRQDVAQWLALPEMRMLPSDRLKLETLQIEFDEVPMAVAHRGAAYQVYRPRLYTLSEVPKTLRSTTYGEMIWRTQLDIPIQHALHAAPNPFLPARSLWSKRLLAMRSFTQATGTWVEITRFAIGVNIDLRYKTGESDRRRLFFEGREGEANCGIGFLVAADALRFTLAPLDMDELRSSQAWPALYRHFGPAFFRHRLLNDPQLGLANLNLSPFAIEWLWQLELSMLTATASGRNCTLAEAVQEVNANRRAYADRTLRAIFQSQLTDEGQFQDGDDPEIVGRLHLQLLEYMETEAVVAALNSASSVLWLDNTPGFDEWMIECYSSSLGAILLETMTRLAPEISPEELALDLDGYMVWISETAAGGVGHISKLTEVITLQPRQFELQLDDVIQHCDRAALANYLRAIASLLAQNDQALQEIFGELRTKVDLVSLSTVKGRLDRLLRLRGLPPTRPLMVGINTKYLRPNSGADSDALVVSLAEAWERESARLGIAIDLRVMAVVARRMPALQSQLDEVLQRINSGQKSTENQIFNLLQSLLWLDCHDSCPECIETWQPYQGLTHPSRALVAALLTSDQLTIDFSSPLWLPAAQQALTTAYQVQVSCTEDQKVALKAALADLLTTPLEIGYQSFYPVVERMIQRGGCWLIQLAIPELINA